MMHTIMIIAGESSGELYGSLLAGELRKKWPDVHLIGIGGKKMKDAGVELIAETSDAFGLIEAVSSYKKIRDTFSKAVNSLKKFRPDVLVPIDYPDFNLKLAEKAKILGVKILYYVSPQVWAWRKGRVKKIARLVDRMAVLFPFEEKIYRDAGVPCEFVGHPIVEEIEDVLKSRVMSQQSLVKTKGQKDSELRANLKSSLGLDQDRTLLSFLPGSRPSELNRHLPLMIEVVRLLRNDHEIASRENYQICMPLAPNTDEEKYRNYLDSLRNEGVGIKKGESVRVLAASDIAVVASGTATLQTALLEVPMIVVYKLSPITYQLGKRIIKVKHISLVNILAGREVVKELLQENANSGEIISELKKIMFDTEYREQMLDSYRKIKEPFSGKKASERVAEIVMEMTGRKE